MLPDPLTPILSQLAVEGSVFSRARLHSPWGVHTRGASSAIFHVIVRGSGFASLRDEAGHAVGSPVAWRAGDLVLFPHGSGHALVDQPGRSTRLITSLTGAPGADGLPCIRAGSQGPETSILCGTLRFDAWAAEMVLPHLPALLHVPADQGPTAAWMDATLRMLGAEVKGAQAGSEAVVGRLAEILFIQAVRSWAASAAVPQASWLGALADPGIARALAAMHGEPEGSWSVEELARIAGMSRSSFASRFAERVGTTPLAHLTAWRLLLARRSLATGSQSVAEIAQTVGYSSEAAFSRAFKRQHGDSPARWRRHHRAEAA